MKDWKKECLELALTTNKSWRQIAREISIPRSTVSDFLREALKEGGLQEVVTEENAPKFLFIDTETSLIKAYVWGLWKQNIGLPQIIEDWHFLCFSAKWLGNDEIINDGLQNYPNEDLDVAEYKIVLNMWHLLDQADIICAYNGVKFDKKKINAKFFEYKLPEPSPYKIVDPYLVVRGNFGFTSNKMDYVAKLTGRQGKKSTNIQLWVECMSRIQESLVYMQEYCDVDVLELEGVYHDVKHWDKSHPNLALYYEDNKPRCNTCGSDKLTPLEVKANTFVSSFSVYRCEDCSKILRDRTTVLDKEKRNSLFMNVR